MHVLVSGSHGLIGSALVPFLKAGGHRVSRLVRSRQSADASEILWDPLRGAVDVERLTGIEAAVHLAGENVAQGRWTNAKKARIRDSRVGSTRLLSNVLAGLPRPPGVLITASAVGYYGDRGDETLTETSAAGEGFLAQVCQAWEAATAQAVERGLRVLHLRIGVVLSRAGGALGALLPPFQLGVGGRLGGGRQYMSWVAIDDVIGAVHHALITDQLRGPVNVVVPQPVTNRELTDTLGRVLRRPTLVPVPAFALRLLLGQMADEALLASARVLPSKLLNTGYAFRYPELEAALRHLLNA